MKAKPKATLVKDVPGVITYWLIAWPSTATKWGKSYRACTYPNSDLVTIYTAAKGRPVSKNVASAIHPQIVEAIEAAKREGKPS